MRDYAKISPHFWIGNTGRKLREAGGDTMLVAFYLLTSPHANMIGLYYLPMPSIAHETGVGTEGASEGLQRAIEAGFCDYDPATEMVIVYEMARYQIAEQLDQKDNRCVGIQREYEALPDNPFLSQFYDKYSIRFHLKNRRDSESPLKGALKPLRSQEQEQEQESTLPQTAFAGAPVVLSNTSKTAKPTEAQIEQLYRLYPRKRDPLKAKKAIRKAIDVVMAGDPDHAAMPLDDALNYLAQRVTLYVKCVQGCDLEFVPYPASWFNAGAFWDDERDWTKNSHRKSAPVTLPAGYLSASERIRQEREAQGDRAVGGLQ